MKMKKFILNDKVLLVFRYSKKFMGLFYYQAKPSLIFTQGCLSMCFKEIDCRQMYFKKHLMDFFYKIDQVKEIALSYFFTRKNKHSNLQKKVILSSQFLLANIL